MAFEPDNKLHAKRKRRRGGRPTKQQLLEKQAQEGALRLAAEMFKKWLEDRALPALQAYFALATGKGRKLDPATCRHFIERFVPPANRTVTLDLQKSAEDFYEKIVGEESERKPEQLH